MPWAISAAGPIFSGSSSYSTAACVTSSSGQLSSSRLFIVRHQRPGRMVNSRLYLAPPPRQDKILTMELLVQITSFGPYGETNPTQTLVP